MVYSTLRGVNDNREKGTTVVYSLFIDCVKVSCLKGVNGFNTYRASNVGSAGGGGGGGTVDGSTTQSRKIPPHVSPEKTN